MAWRVVAVCLVAALALGCTRRPAQPGSSEAEDKPGLEQGKVMEPQEMCIETERLVIRKFTEEDWADIQDLAIDKESSEGAKYDHTWPTSEKDCKGVAGFFSRDNRFRAVCLKADKKIIGLIALNGLDDQGQADLGHVFHTKYGGRDYDTEAIAHAIDYAFTHMGATGVFADNAEDWAVQLAPLRKLGMRIKPPPEGKERTKSSLALDSEGKPIEFYGCRMEITKEEWLRSGWRGKLKAGQ